jgi:glycosyltransferase involved in cell wall biosynthesis
MQPLVSVIIPTYNRADFLGQALDSALGQTYKRMEIIVVDDGSTDQTAQLLDTYRKHIRYIYQEHSERSKARNLGITESSGEYIAFLDSDDLWLPEKVECQVKILRKDRSIGVSYTGVQYMNEDGSPYEGKICWAGLERRRRYLYEDLMTRNVISGSASSVLLRRDCLDVAGGFDETMNACEDMDLWRRLALCCRFHKIDLPLVKLRIHPSNTQGGRSEMAKGYQKILWKICRENIPFESRRYRNEAIVKLLAQIASLYRQDHSRGRTILLCGKCLATNIHCLLTMTFWYDLFRVGRNRFDRSPGDAEQEDNPARGLQSEKYT